MADPFTENFEARASGEDFDVEFTGRLVFEVRGFEFVFFYSFHGGEANQAIVETGQFPLKGFMCV